MKITVKSNFVIPDIPMLGEKAGLRTQSGTLRSLLNELSSRSHGRIKFIDPRTGGVCTAFGVFVNGSPSYSLPQGLDSELRNGDEILITLIVVCGG